MKVSWCPGLPFFSNSLSSCRLNQNQPGLVGHSLTPAGAPTGKAASESSVGGSRDLCSIPRAGLPRQPCVFVREIPSLSP